VKKKSAYENESLLCNEISQHYSINLSFSYPSSLQLLFKYVYPFILKSFYHWRTWKLPTVTFKSCVMEYQIILSILSKKKLILKTNIGVLMRWCERLLPLYDECVWLTIQILRWIHTHQVYLAHLCYGHPYYICTTWEWYTTLVHVL
jgi:hypothetical protein